MRVLLLKTNERMYFLKQTKMGGSRSGSVQSFDEALREATANQEGGSGDLSKPNGTSGQPGSGGDEKPPV